MGKSCVLIGICRTEIPASLGGGPHLRGRCAVHRGVPPGVHQRRRAARKVRVQLEERDSRRSEHRGQSPGANRETLRWAPRGIRGGDWGLHANHNTSAGSPSSLAPSPTVCAPERGEDCLEVRIVADGITAYMNGRLHAGHAFSFSKSMRSHHVSTASGAC